METGADIDVIVVDVVDVIVVIVVIVVDVVDVNFPFSKFLSEFNRPLRKNFPRKLFLVSIWILKFLS